MSEADGNPDSPQRQEARRWLSIAREDLDVALAAARLPRPGSSAYHLQQSAEKLLKALLTLTSTPFRRTHDLDELADPIPSLFPHLAKYANAVRHMTVWGIAYRYPTLEEEPLPSDQELAEMAELPSEFLHQVQRLIDDQP